MIDFWVFFVCIFVDLGRIELPPPRCERDILPLNYRPSMIHYFFLLFVLIKFIPMICKPRIMIKNAPGVKGVIRKVTPTNNTKTPIRYFNPPYFTEILSEISVIFSSISFISIIKFCRGGGNRIHATESRTLRTTTIRHPAIFYFTFIYLTQYFCFVA